MGADYNPGAAHECAVLRREGGNGGRGKILIDVDDNRYLIPDLDALDPKQRSDFQRYIYW